MLSYSAWYVIETGIDYTNYEINVPFLAPFPLSSHVKNPMNSIAESHYPDMEMSSQ